MKDLRKIQAPIRNLLSGIFASQPKPDGTESTGRAGREQRSTNKRRVHTLADNMLKLQPLVMQPDVHMAPCRLLHSDFSHARKGLCVNHRRQASGNSIHGNPIAADGQLLQKAFGWPAQAMKDL